MTVLILVQGWDDVMIRVSGLWLVRFCVSGLAQDQNQGLDLS